MQEFTLGVQGMTCGGCARSVEKVLKAVPGVSAVSVSLADGKVLVSHDGTADLNALRGAVEDAGYETAA